MPINKINSPYVLVVGGAGFIGSHMVLALNEAGFKPIVLDNLSKGHRDAVLNAPLIVGEMGDKALLADLFSTYPIAVVMHFASFIEVGESVILPGRYYQNNVAATLNLLEVMLEKNVKQFIFSSSAAVYGEPLYTPMDEAHRLQPINPYGRSKWMVEEILKDYAKSDGLRYAILRYFNAAGAHPSHKLRERHEPESHLIPLVLQVAAGLRDHIVIHGDDYETPDGTCVRDYIHVADLCTAHLLTLNYLADNPSLLCNLGIGHGYSVREVIEKAREITGHKIPAKIGKRRPGDPAVLVADATFAKTKLNWTPIFPELKSIIAHAWETFSAETQKT